MVRALSSDLRDRLVAAVVGGTSCRRAAERFGVSAASTIRWRQLSIRHGTPADKSQGGDRRSARIEAHAGFLLDAWKRRSPAVARSVLRLAPHRQNDLRRAPPRPLQERGQLSQQSR